MRVPDDTLGAWRAFLNAHALATKRINRDLAEAGLPDLTWYDVLWTLRSADGSRAAHVEHTVAVTDDGPRILTAPR